jgi:hypothetical protein
MQTATPRHPGFSTIETTMPASFAPTFRPPSRAQGHGVRPRGLLAIGVWVAVWAAVSLSGVAAHADIEPELAMLLRGMAVIKGLLTLAAVACVMWRLGRAVSPWALATYLVGTWLLAFANTLIWQLSWIGAAAALYHVGLLSLLVAAWRDDLPLARAWVVDRRSPAAARSPS